MERACVRKATLVGAAQGLDITMGAIALACAVIRKSASCKCAFVEVRGMAKPAYPLLRAKPAGLPSKIGNSAQHHGAIFSR